MDKTAPIRAAEAVRLESRHDLLLYLHVRARMQTLSDARILHGWINHITPEKLAMLTKMPAVQPGERMLLEMFGDGKAASCEVVVATHRDGVVVAIPNSDISERPSSESVRHLMFGAACRISADFRRLDGTVQDIGYQGFSVHLMEPLPKSASVHATLNTPVGEITAMGKVKYSRPIQAHERAFRIGIQITHMERLEMARWRRLLTIEQV